jgi:signal transduction histidine kinase
MPDLKMPTFPRRWRHLLPRPTVRLRLTLVYGGLFLGSGAGLLTITYLLVRSTGVLILNTSPSGPELSAPVFDSTPTTNDAKQGHAALVHQLLIESGVGLAIMAVVSIGLGWLVAGRVLRPLRTITAAARHLSASNLHERLAFTGPDDELKELADTFDGLLARLEQSFDAQRRFVANASHELRTPLARQRTLLEVALADPRLSVASLAAACQRVLVAGEQQERLIEALLTLARSQRGLDRVEPVDLAAVTDAVITSRRAEAERRDLVISADLGPATVAGDDRLAERLVANLLDNALRHNTTGGRVWVSTAAVNGHAVLSVANTGPTIPPTEVGQLFLPFQRLGPDRTANRDGHGLGLSIVHAIADAHDAPLRGRALPGGGLEVEVRFPSTLRS